MILFKISQKDLKKFTNDISTRIIKYNFLNLLKSDSKVNKRTLTSQDTQKYHEILLTHYYYLCQTINKVITLNIEAYQHNSKIYYNYLNNNSDNSKVTNLSLKLINIILRLIRISRR